MANLLERLEQLRAAVAEAAPGNARAALEAALAEQLILRGEYAEALVYLAAARRAATAPPLREHVELSMGVALLRRGETERAGGHLERALSSAQARGSAAVELAHLGEVYRRRGEPERARAAFEAAQRETLPADLMARVQTGLAWLAVEAGALDEAESLALAAVDGSGGEDAASAACESLQALAEIRWRKGDPAAAERLCRQAIDIATRAGLNRELAEAYYAYSHLVGRAGDALPQKGREPPASWLARAQELFRSHGALADLERVREAFRRFGRRATDHVAAVEVKAMIDDLRSARLIVAREAHQLTDAVEHAVRRLEDEPASPDALRELRQNAALAEQSVARSVETMSLSEGRVFGAIQAVISERENIRTLLDLCRALNEQRDYGRLVSEIARMSAQLTGADRALIALADGDGLSVRASWHIADLADDAGWRPVLAELLRGGGPMLVAGDAPARRGAEELRLGRALATPLRQGDKVFGAVYVDKDLGGGLFTPHELDLLSIFCAQAATTLENARVAEQLRLAARSRAATLEAISDGVISFDRQGVITSINAVAARMLAVPPDAEAAIARFPDLAFLRAALERGDELDGRVTRVGAGEYLLNLRLVLSDTGEAVGGVATLAEMKRVQAIAQRIVGAQARYSFNDLIGEAPSLRRRLLLARAAARSGSSVLITGESGTGKEVLAQAIHNESARSSGPFVGINCSAIPRELIESELFGYEGGAFTGAKKGGHPGKFELAEGGTILLDEIGDMPIEMQAKLLRVLQERRVHRIGGTREVTLDARVIATTNRDLEEGVTRGQFRSDLLFRLKVIEIALPPLRDRASDVPVLAAHFLKLFAARLGKSVEALSVPVLDAFLKYPWPGNIRELENVLEGEVNLVEPGQRVLDQIPEALRVRRRTPSSVPILSSDALTLDEAERELLVKALSRHGGNIPDVARTLGVSRGTVYNKLHRFSLDADEYRVTHAPKK